jgi:hypothetical protein
MLKESTELASAAKIHELLVPFEYTRLDKMIGVAFTVAEEVSEAVEEQTPADAAADIDSPKQRHAPGDVIEQVRTKIVSHYQLRHLPLALPAALVI